MITAWMPSRFERNDKWRFFEKTGASYFINLKCKYARIGKEEWPEAAKNDERFINVELKLKEKEMLDRDFYQDFWNDKIDKILDLKGILVVNPLEEIIRYPVISMPLMHVKVIDFTKKILERCGDRVIFMISMDIDLNKKVIEPALPRYIKEIVPENDIYYMWKQEDLCRAIERLVGTRLEHRPAKLYPEDLFA
jgi:hypothetical protein